MIIVYHKQFKKKFEKLPSNLKIKTINVIEIFLNNPIDKQLCNHYLKGKLIGKKALSVNYDLRIIYTEHDNYNLITLLDIGTHNSVYN